MKKTFTKNFNYQKQELFRNESLHNRVKLLALIIGQKLRTKKTKLHQNYSFNNYRIFESYKVEVINNTNEKNQGWNMFKSNVRNIDYIKLLI
ncbi:hypothetical protein HYD97_02685 [Mycoplasmopsis bovis]|nr:hypothetical protein [Mycoplasmopsis bovis]QQH34454.1 hypothetical protein HYD97_02685 [Mycoplasmopsis bovis]